MMWLRAVGYAILVTVLFLLPLAPPVAFGVQEPEDLLNSRIPSRSSGDLAGTPDLGVMLNMELVGSHNLGGRGFNADVWVHEHTNGMRVAYVGQWGFGDAQHPDRCPSGDKSGVKVLDVTNPASPRLIATLQNPPQTTAEDVEVVRYTSRSRGRSISRDIAMVGIQACFRLDPNAKRGLQLFDVTNPASPVEVGFLDTGLFSRGVHEFTAVVRRDGVFAILAVPFSQLRDAAGRGDVRIADVTNPASPIEVADFHFERDAGLPGNLEGFGCFPFNFAHGAAVNEVGTLAFISSFDLGTVILDITDPAVPDFLGRTPYPANVEGDAHSADLSVDERYLYQAEEVIPPNSNCQAPDRQQTEAWGFVRIFDLSAGFSSPPQVGTFKTENSLRPSRQRKGDYSVHNPLVVGNTLYTSWYSDGVRVADLADNPVAPVERAFVVPPAVKDPLRVLGYVPEVWGVVVDDRGCVYLSDMNGGLYVAREKVEGACGN